MGLAAAMCFLMACCGAALAYFCLKAALSLRNDARRSRKILAAALFLLGLASAAGALLAGYATWSCLNYHF